MTFELTAEQETAREKARAFAVKRVAPHAAAIDRDAAVPAALLRDIAGVLIGGDSVATVAAVEEIAVASATLSLIVGAATGAATLGLGGLRGAVMVEDSPRGHLVLAGAALGIGRAALDTALVSLREATANPGRDGDKPHWVVADAATELQAARLLTLSAAQALDTGSGDTEVAMARLMASAAARTAVEAALRIAGPSGLAEGALLERLSRDVRAVSLLLGGEEQQRAAAAEGLLPA